MVFSRLFKPNVEKLKRKRDLNGLLKALRYGESYSDSDKYPYCFVRRDAARAVGEVGDESAIQPLVRALFRDKDPSVRESAADALGRIGDPSAIQPLIRALGDDEDELMTLRVIKSAADALGRIGDESAIQPLIRALERWGPGGLRESVAIALGRIGDATAVAPLFLILEGSSGTYFEALKHILDRDAKAVGVLIGFPRHEKYHLITSIIREMKDATRAVEPLIPWLKDEDMDIRLSAAKILVEIADPKAVDPLIQSLVQAIKDKEEDNRINAAWLLKEIRNANELRPFIESLIQSLKDDNSSVRKHVVVALGNAGDSKATESLIQILKDETSPPNLQIEAAVALGKIGDLLAVDPIISWIFSGAQKFHDKSDFDEFSVFTTLLGDYTNLILKSAYYFREKRTDQVYGTAVTGRISQYDIQESDIAVQKLCGIRTKISDNILHKISNKKDIRVELQTDYGIQGDGMGSITSFGKLSFAHQRDMATRELSQRGNPPYDPSIYLQTEAWKLGFYLF